MKKNKSFRVLVAGSKGQLGYELLKRSPGGSECLGVDLPETDITNLESILKICFDFQPEVVINAAAYTAVDRAEVEVETARLVNAVGAGNLAEVAEESGSRLISVSTDFVFSGDANRPYKVTDPADPLGIYGKTKLDGERKVREKSPGASIVRTSWLYSSHGNNFVKAMLRLMKERDELKVVCDQVGSPTWAGGLAEALWMMAGKPEARGIYHWSDLGVASWYDFAVAIFEESLLLGLVPDRVRVVPVSSEAYPTPARRPFYSVMDTSKIRGLLGIPGVHWRENLRKMLRELK